MTTSSTMEAPAVATRWQGSVALVLSGLLAGAAWGVVARLWMRFISAEHEFSWSGTLTIVGIFALCGMGQALAAAALRGDWSRPARIGAQSLAVATALPLGLAAGMIMLPSTLLAAVALGRKRMDRRWRIALAMLAIIPAAMVLAQLLDELPVWRALVGWVLMFAVYLPIVWALSRTFGALRPWEGRPPKRTRLAIMLVGAIVAAGLFMMAIGLSPPG